MTSNDNKQSAGAALESFVAVIAALRAEGGCPWDREQTHQSLKKNLLEECYEVLDAIDAGSDVKLCDELGDVLLQVVFHAQIAAEENRFSMIDVIDNVKQKMIRRHPHVFGGAHVENSHQVLNQWEIIKAQEKADNGATKKHIMEINSNLPAVLMAQKAQEKAARVGFDWSDIADVKQKLAEELLELDAAESEKERFEELGDLLFAVINLSRFLDVDAELSLRQSTKKFISRFDFMEELLRIDGVDWNQLNAADMDKLWRQAKAEEKTALNNKTKQKEVK